VKLAVIAFHFARIVIQRQSGTPAVALTRIPWMHLPTGPPAIVATALAALSNAERTSLSASTIDRTAALRPNWADRGRASIDNECLLRPSVFSKPPFRSREEFQTPLGVGKSPRNEPAVCRARLMGI